MHQPWLRHYPPNIPHSLRPYPEIPLYQLLTQAAADSPQRTALVFYGTNISYLQLDHLSSSLAHSLQTRLEIKKGHRVGVLLPNMPEFIIAYFGILKAGGVVVPLNTLTDTAGLKHQIDTAQINTLIILDRFLNRLPPIHLTHLITVKVNTFLPWYLKLLKTSFSSSKGISFSHLLQAPPNYIDPNIQPKTDLSLILFTSGLRGQPKGVKLTHFNVVANSLQACIWSDTHYDKTPSLMPLFHCYGIIASLQCSLYSRSTYYLYPTLDLNRILKDCRRYQFTFFTAVPLIYRLIASHPLFQPTTFTSVWTMASGGESPSARLFHQYYRLPLCQGYGLTEATSVVMGNPVRGHIKPNSIGIPIPDTDAQIIDPQGRPLPLGKTGQLIIKGPQVMQGYLNNPTLTRKTIKDGWLYTGDLVKMDSEGYFYFVRRMGKRPTKQKLNI